MGGKAKKSKIRWGKKFVEHFQQRRGRREGWVRRTYQGLSIFQRKEINKKKKKEV